MAIFAGLGGAWQRRRSAAHEAWIVQSTAARKEAQPAAAELAEKRELDPARCTRAARPADLMASAVKAASSMVKQLESRGYDLEMAKIALE